MCMAAEGTDCANLVAVSDSIEINRANWDERAPAHAASPGYAIGRFLADSDHISDVVTFDRPLLGSVAGERGIHLQCHIGTDTISLARLGARMSGLDFSSASIAEARRLADQVGADVDFVESEVYDAVDVLGAGRFDLVYTGVGALIWLPDIERWAGVVATLLRPGGRLFVRDGHPMMNAVAEPRPDGLLVVDHPYFEHAEPTVWDGPETYVETDAVFTNTVTHEWNHGLGQIVMALLDNGMELTMLVEHDSAPWDAMGTQMEHVGGGEWRLVDRPQRLACTFTLAARKRS